MLNQSLIGSRSRSSIRHFLQCRAREAKLLSSKRGKLKKFPIPLDIVGYP